MTMADLPMSGSLMRALVPELLLVTGALGLLLATVWQPQGQAAAAAEGAERTSIIVRFAMLLCGITGIAVIIAWGDAAAGTADGRIAGDGFRWAVDLVILGGTGLVLALLDADHERSQAFSPEVPVLLLLSASGMMILAAARDLMIVFLGIELMSLAVYVLAGVNRRSARGAESAIKYFLLGAFSTGFLLYGMALVFGATGSTRYADIAAWITQHPALSPMLRIGMGLLLVGFAFKVAAAPFHVWTPDVYDGAPLPITAFMAAVVKTAAFAAFLRLMTDAFVGPVAEWHVVLWWLAVVTMVLGNVLALSQTNLVRMLGYSSIAHAGYLLVTIIAHSSGGVSALLFYVVTYTLATMAAFGVLITVNDGRDRAPTLADVTGLWTTRPGLAVAMAVSLLALLGMPLAGGMGFFAKWYLLQAAWQAAVPQSVLAIVLVLSSVVSAGYYLKVIAAMFMRPPAADSWVAAPVPMAQGVLVLCTVALLILGLVPSPVSRLAGSAHLTTGTDLRHPIAPAPVTTPLSTASLTR
jgi:NADH-quinone oxidoreductase subunit N